VLFRSKAELANEEDIKESGEVIAEEAAPESEDVADSADENPVADEDKKED